MTLLRFPWGVEGYLHRSEGRALFDVASQLPADSSVVELGAYKGRSTICLAQSGRRVVSVDHWSGEPGLPKVPGVYPDHRDGFYRRQYEENLDKWVPGWRGFVFPYSGSSSDAELAAAIASAFAPIGMVFIDADHKLAAVRADFATWAPLVPVGGIVALHDQHWLGPATVIRDAVEGGEWESRGLVRDLRVLARVSAAAVNERASESMGVA